MSGLDLELEKSENDSPVRKKKSVAGGEIPRLIYSFFHDLDMNLWLNG